MIRLFVRDKNETGWNELELSSDTIDEFQLNSSIFDPDDRLSYSVDHSFTFDLYQTKSNFDALGVELNDRYSIVGQSRFALLETDRIIYTTVGGKSGYKPVTLKGTLTLSKMDNTKYTVTFTDIIKSIFSDGYSNNTLYGLSVPVYRLPYYYDDSHTTSYMTTDTMMNVDGQNYFIDSSNVSHIIDYANTNGVIGELYAFVPTLQTSNDELFEKDKTMYYTNNAWTDNVATGVSNVGFKRNDSVIGDIKTYSMRMAVRTSSLFSNIKKWIKNTYDIEFVYPDIPNDIWYISGKQRDWTKSLTSSIEESDNKIFVNKSLDIGDVYDIHYTGRTSTGKTKKVFSIYELNVDYQYGTTTTKIKLNTLPIPIRDLITGKGLDLPKIYLRGGSWFSFTIGVWDGKTNNSSQTYIISETQDVFNQAKSAIETGYYDSNKNIPIENIDLSKFNSGNNIRWIDSKTCPLVRKSDGIYVFYPDGSFTIESENLIGTVYIAMTTGCTEYFRNTIKDCIQWQYLYSTTPTGYTKYLNNSILKYYSDYTIRISSIQVEGSTLYYGKGNSYDIYLNQYWNDTETLRDIIIGYAKLNGWYMYTESGNIEFIDKDKLISSSSIVNVDDIIPDSYEVISMPEMYVKTTSSTGKEITDNPKGLNSEISIDEVSQPMMYYSYLYDNPPYINTDQFLYIKKDSDKGCFVKNTGILSLYKYCFSNFYNEFYQANDNKDALVKSTVGVPYTMDVYEDNIYLMDYPDFQIGNNYNDIADNGTYKLLMSPGKYNTNSDRINPSKYVMTFDGVIPKVVIGGRYIIDSKYWVLVKYEGLTQNNEGTFTFIKYNE